MILPSSTSFSCILVVRGTGKTQIIKAIVAAMRILKREQEVILLAATGAAADNMGGNTIHTALGMSIGTKQNRALHSGSNDYGPEKPS